MTLENIVGPWPRNFPLLVDNMVEEGLVVWSQSHAIEGRTTGYRCPCFVPDCEGWFIGVNWETGQYMKICSKGWEYDSVAHEVHLTKGGEISGRYSCGGTKDTPPLPRVEWPDRRVILRRRGWRVSPPL